MEMVGRSDGGITKWLWSYIKAQRKDNFGVTSLKHNENAYNDNQMRAELLNNYLTSVFTTCTLIRSFSNYFWYILSWYCQYKNVVQGL